MDQVTKCPFCSIYPNERVIRRGEVFTSLLSNPRLAAGHVLVIPNRHIEAPIDLEVAEFAQIFTEIQRLQSILLEKMAPGCDVWQKYQPFKAEDSTKVNHVHFHVIPRSPEDDVFATDSSGKNGFVPLSDEERDRLIEMLA